jgi:hypothetical protein
MDTTTRIRRDERARAMARLRNLTIGTALAGTAATVGLGLFVADTTATAGNASNGTTTTTVTTAANGTTTTTTATPTQSTTTTRGTVSSSTGRGQVTTGGS